MSSANDRATTHLRRLGVNPVTVARLRGFAEADGMTLADLVRYILEDTRRMKRYWTCPKGCGGRWGRSLVKCRTEGCEGRRPRKRGAAHSATLRDDSYAVYEALNGELHAGAFDGEWTPDRCGACGRPPTPNRKSDRDHDHTTGRPRGLLCGGDTGCNVLLPRWVTVPVARAIADTKLVAGERDAERWDGLAAYLERVEAYEQARLHGAVA